MRYKVLVFREQGTADLGTGHRESGVWGDGEMGRWGDGELGRWGAGEMGRLGGTIKTGLDPQDSSAPYFLLPTPCSL
ncbi:hypothetical protein [Moorena sp. SIO3H5]|uniref:hypothetical protein n=1 Tax=Moorena sp. SIO3H5 TaxID=2607834 RepID=UPI0025E80473|nr:hypothetical protein [Moorena sp. SIO3H5]